MSERIVSMLVQVMDYWSTLQDVRPDDPRANWAAYPVGNGRYCGDVLTALDNSEAQDFTFHG